MFPVHPKPYQLINSSNSQSRKLSGQLLKFSNSSLPQIIQLLKFINSSNSSNSQILKFSIPKAFGTNSSTPQSRKLSGQIFQIFKSSVKTKNPKRGTRNPKLPRKISELCNILMAQCKNSDTKTYHLCIKTNNTKPMPFRRNALNKNLKKTIK